MQILHCSADIYLHLHGFGTDGVVLFLDFLLQCFHPYLGVLQRGFQADDFIQLVAHICLGILQLLFQQGDFPRLLAYLQN